MIIIESYLKNPLSESEEYINIEDKTKMKTIKDKIDKLYLEGAIIVEFNGEKILGIERTDLVDQLWAYMMNSFEELVEKEVSEFYLPDQNLRCELKNVKGNEIRFTIGDHSYELPKELFWKEMVEAARYFFENIEKTFNWDGYYEDNIKQIESLENVIKGDK